jgi:hypothetical protein
VQLVQGPQSPFLDTALVRYALDNRSSQTYKVGLRIMLDTYIGTTDGVPFAVPGRAGLLRDKAWFVAKNIPDYIQALEFPDLEHPGCVAQLGLRLPDLESVDRMLIAASPGSKDVGWEWEPRAMNENPQKKDSSVTLYWAEREVQPGEKREMGFTYGLNSLSGGEESGGRLALTVGGDFRPDGEFTVTAYLGKPQPGQLVRLNLPADLSFAPGVLAEQKATADGEYTQVSWRVRSGPVGDYVLETLSAGLRATQSVRIRANSL